MNRKFNVGDPASVLSQSIKIEEVIPPEHLARFVIEVINFIDMSKFYARYGSRGGEAIAPEVLLRVLLYGYATGIFSSRKIERATYENIPFRYVAGGLHPDHDTIAHFRKQFLEEIKDVFVQILLLAKAKGVLKVGNISLDGSKIHADASKSHAVSYGRAEEIEIELKKEVEELLALSEETDSNKLPPDLNIATEVSYRKERLAGLAEAKAVIEARAKERDVHEKAEYDERMKIRAAKEAKSGKKLGGRVPIAPTPGPQAKDQYNFTDPESRIMKNARNQGVDQSYNAQVAVDQKSMLILGNTLSNHATDHAETIPTIDAISPKVGKPKAAALDNGYWRPEVVEELIARGITPYIAIKGHSHSHDWKLDLVPCKPPPEDASVLDKMRYALSTATGREIYRLRKSTVEPVFGIIKEVLGFCQFSLRGLVAAAGEWNLVCAAFNIKHLHSLLIG